jgi:3-dehydroquinate dehydratase-1
MRQQSKKQLQIRGVLIGGTHPLICLPLVAGTKEELIGQASILVELAPDLLEWRVDGFTGVEDVTKSLAALSELRSIIGEIPLIFTCRIDQEGGMRIISQEKRLELIVAAIASGHIDLVDIELCNGQEFIDAVKMHTQARHVALILSYHNFKETPDETFIYDKLLAAYEAGADIPKLAVMPKDYADVLTLFNATNRARNSAIEAPLVTMSMGVQGAVTRLAGGLFGSDITFAVGKASSAPGQIPIAEMRSGMAVLFGVRPGV